MDIYSEEIFEIIGTIENEKEKYKPNQETKSQIETLEQLLNANTIEELEKIEDKSLVEEIKLKKIAIKLNNFEFEQYINAIEKCKKHLEELKIKEQENNKKYEELSKKQEVYEYIYNLKLPIDDTDQINEIIKRCKESDIDAKEILKIINEENIRCYTNETKKEKLLSQEKMNELNIDIENQEKINKIKELISKSKNIKEDKNTAEYLLSLDEETLLTTIDEIKEFNEQRMLNIMKSLLIKINNNETLNKSLELLFLIYDSLNNEEEIINDDTKKSKLIFVSKPTNLDLYIYDDISKIEHRIYLKILENQFKKLINGDTQGKSLTGLPENLFEKKASQVRITYKVLPNNYILILNCYTKGNKFTQNIRELIEKPNISYQIHLYDVLATENPTLISEFLNKFTHISKQEQENYISNFTESQRINILDQFKEGEKIARKNKKSN